MVGGLLAISTVAGAAVTKHGAGVALKAAPVKVAALLAKPEGYEGKTVVVEGMVRAACTRKGCWMELAPSAEKGTAGCRVTFKDYGFFVPTDAAGAKARVEGVVGVKTIAAAEVAHLEGEGAVFGKKGKDGSAQEVRIVATGVELER
ncbi:MAG: hypothetical protein JWN44_5865 [Myxococcales bacterium]|nr:hypothetical protein [Myxococcales bacterium]